jgi:hypothetical protein
MGFERKKKNLIVKLVSIKKNKKIMEVLKVKLG